MTSYQYIVDLFTGILSHSKAIEGRFHVGYRYGLQEINYDQLGEVLGSQNFQKKYPLVLMAPPTGQFRIGGNRNEWRTYRIILYFCKTSFYGEGAEISPLTRTSDHAVHDDWHDMDRCAINFLRVLRSQQEMTALSGNFRYNLPTNEILTTPFSVLGADRISGVHANFDFQVFNGCELQDYEEYPDQINISADPHPEHKL